LFALILTASCAENLSGSSKKPKSQNKAGLVRTKQMGNFKDVLTP